jgi:pentatricopeptide repeat protein
VQLFNATIDACSSSGLWQEALSLLREMAQRNVTPNLRSYCATMNACSKGGQWQLAVELLQEMAEQGLTPDVTCYTAAIDACSGGGQWQKAIELLRKMLQQSIRADVKCYTAAIDACSDSGQRQQAVELLHEMQEQCITPNIRTYNCTINACQRGGNWQLAADLINSLKAAEHALKPDRVTYGCVIDALHAANEDKQAEELYIEMLESGLTKHHWSTKDRGKLDFHDFTEGMAAAAMRLVLRASVAQAATAHTSRGSATELYMYVHPIETDLHIITGHGTGDGKQGSVLQPAIIQLLKQLHIERHVSSNNKGRLVGSSSELQQYKGSNLRL